MTNTYTASIQQPDGLRICVEISAPADRKDVDELSELAQMAVMRAKNLVARSQRTFTEQDAPF